MTTKYRHVILFLFVFTGFFSSSEIMGQEKLLSQEKKTVLKQTLANLGQNERIAIRGIVRDRDDKSSVGNAIVFLVPEFSSGVPLKTVADKDGLFEFVYEHHGNYPFTLFALTPDKKRMGYKSIREDDIQGAYFHWELDKNRATQSAEKLPRRFTVKISDNECFCTTGTVKDVSGKPVEGALIYNEQPISFQGVSDAKGQFEFYTTHDFPREIFVVKSGVGLAYMSSPWWKGRDPERERKNNTFYKPVEIVLAPPSPLRLVVVDSKNIPVSNCEIYVHVRAENVDEYHFPNFVLTDQNGIAIVDHYPNTHLRPYFNIRPPDQLRRYADGSAARLIPDQKENVFNIDNMVSGQFVDELRCVIPFKAEMKIKLINPFAVPNGKPELKFPNVSVNAGRYGYLPDIANHRNDSMYEFTVYSNPRQHFKIRCKLSDGNTSVFPTVRGIMGDGFTPLETTITLQKGTPLRLRLFDENGKTLNWKENHYSAFINEIVPNSPTNALADWRFYEFGHSLREVESGVEELVCYLPQGKFQVNAELHEGYYTQTSYIPYDPTQALPRTIKESSQFPTCRTTKKSFWISTWTIQT
ncbi:MAG: hypothetical protein LBK06_08475 [Planctomycetaceae bacterium]|nr:hypothetical protein [Planctomycetaceae bacterium]